PACRRPLVCAWLKLGVGPYHDSERESAYHFVWRRKQIMENVPDSALGRMYREHINLILKKDIEGLLDQYTDDALLISSFMKTPLYYRGREELREHMQGILGIQGLQTEIAFWAETENPQTIMIVEK